MNTNEPLDGFERSLLTELRAHVADGGGLLPTRRTSRGWIAGVATLGVAAITVAAVTLSAPSSTAFAVEPEPTGAVVVHVYRLADAPLLEKALARAGVNAAVSYTGDVPSWARNNAPMPEGPGVDADDYNAPWDPGSCTVWSSLGKDGVTVRIPARAVGAKSILRIELAGSPDVRHGQETMVIGFDQPPC